MTDDYDVGYKKPPKHSRFKKGQSGNPRGRPRRPKHKEPAAYGERMKALMMEEAYRPVDIQEGGKTIRLPLIQVMIRRMGVLAAQGNSRAMRDYTDLLRLIEEEKWASYSAYLKQLVDYKMDFGKEFERRKKLNPSEPEPIPHPDDIIINTSTGTVELRGPMTKEEKVYWDRIEESEATIAELESMLAEDPKDEILKEDLAHERRVRKQLARAVPDYRPRPSRREARQEARLRAFKSFLEQFDPQPTTRSHRKSRARRDK
jgi:Family of unknown function (DUF5681)